jgi:flagellar assembly factor FliW
MDIKTRDFGDLSIDSEALVHFRMTIYGFEEYSDFALLSDPDIGESIVWLQSVQAPNLCFILVDPKIAAENYEPKLNEETRKTLKAKGICEPAFWAIAVIPQEFSNSTVNLKSPVLIDLGNKSAAQIILDEDYPIRAPLMPAGKGRG